MGREFPFRKDLPSISARFLVTLALCLITESLVSADASSSFIVFDPPDSIETVPTSINEAGDIVGYYYYDENTTNTRGFVRTADGTITSIDLGSNQTYILSINKSDYSTGYYCSGNECDAFIRSPDGTITTFTAGRHAYVSTAVGINSRGAIVGWGEHSHASWGYVRAPGGKFTSFEADTAKKTQTYASDINDTGTVIGIYYDQHKNEGGFIRSPDGSITTYSPEGAIELDAASINAAGTIAGDYFDNKSDHSFLRNPDGTILEFDPPNAVQSAALGINKHDSIVGSFFDINGIQHGYTRTKAGKFLSFDPKNSISTCAKSINDGGEIIGYFEDVSDIVHGYLRTP